MIKDSETPIPMQGGGVVLPEGVSFDGVTDYISRSTDLVGNTTTKTLTISAWVYASSLMGSQFPIYENHDGVNRNYLDISGAGSANGYINFILRNSAGTIILNMYTPSNPIAKNTDIHILISIDMANVANRSIYINDTLISTASWGTFTNDFIPLMYANHWIGKNVNNVWAKGRLSNLFLDYTYRDLSIEANRRLFITAEGKPADGLASLNPILYLPMTDASTAHINSGTGGDFVQNGLLATADRGANQDNCVQSTFEGVDDYLSNTGIGAVDGKEMSLSFTFTSSETMYPVFARRDDGTVVNLLEVGKNGAILNISIKNSSNSTICYCNVVDVLTSDRQNSISLSINTAEAVSTDAIKLTINGKLITDYYSIGHIQDSLFSFSYISGFGFRVGSLFLVSSGSIGELYFDTNYIDLATNNPFWDSETNRPNSVRKVMRDIGSAPLICMPLDASNPTKNYGSGGDFSLSGGGLTGARGQSEYIARSVAGNVGTTDTLRTNYLQLNNVSTPTNISSFSLALSFKSNDASARADTLLFRLGGVSNLAIFLDVFENFICDINGLEEAGNVSGFASLGWRTVLISYSSTGTSMYIDSLPYSITYNNDIVGGTTDISILGSSINVTAAVGTYDWEGYMSNVYFTTDYIDFSSEANRNLFVNQLGYVRNLTPEIEAGNIPTPLFYLKFDDTSNLGLDSSGNNNHFTTNGSVTAGADFTI